MSEDHSLQNTCCLVWEVAATLVLWILQMNLSWSICWKTKPNICTACLQSLRISFDLCSADICSIIMLLSLYVHPRVIQTWTTKMWTAPIFFLKGCEYWLLGLPQRTRIMPILTLSNLFSICRSTCVSAQVTLKQSFQLIFTWPFNKSLQIDLSPDPKSSLRSIDASHVSLFFSFGPIGKSIYAE